MFDAVDRVVETEDPLGNTMTRTFDDLGRLVSSEDPDGRLTEWGHDAMGRVTEVTAPGQGTTSWVFDDVNRTVTRTDGRGHDVTFSFDAAGRLVEAANELDHTSTWEFDLAGQLVEATSPTGVVSTVTYDDAGRRTAVTHSDATPTTTWVYDLAGRVISVGNTAQTVEFTYDEQGRIVEQASGLDAISWEWTAAGRPAARTQPDGTEFTYTYDDAGRATTVGVDLDQIDITLDPVGAPVNVTYPNGMEHDTTFDAAGRLVSSRWTTPGTPSPVTVAEWVFTRDDSGRPTSVDRTLATAVETLTFAYDAAGRLTDECVGSLGSDCTTATSVTEFTFDEMSNMTSRTDAAGTVTNTFDSADRLISATDGTTVTSNTFDDAGRLTASTDGTTARSWAWDANSKIVAMNDGPTTTNQTVGPFGMPVATDDGVDTVPSMWDHTSSGATPGLLEHGDVSYLTADGSNLLAADVDTGSGVQREWLVTDPQGTPVTSTDGTGALTAAPAAPDAFGGSPAGVAGLGFLGLPDGADGNAALRARHMDPVAGGFLSPDPLNDPLVGVFDPVAPTVSAYVYGEGAPTVYVDPSGLQSDNAGNPHASDPRVRNGQTTRRPSAPKEPVGASIMLNKVGVGGTCRIGWRTLPTAFSGNGAAGCKGGAVIIGEGCSYACWAATGITTILGGVIAGIVCASTAGVGCPAALIAAGAATGTVRHATSQKSTDGLLCSTITGGLGGAAGGAAASRVAGQASREVTGYVSGAVVESASSEVAC